MKTNQAWIRTHSRIVIAAIAIVAFIGFFFLVPVIHVIGARCTLGDDWQSLGYYLINIGVHSGTASPPCS